jgi:hypothetical protein
MRQMYRSHRKAARKGVTASGFSIGADGGADRRGASRLLAVTAAGVAGPGILRASSAKLGTVSGTVSGPGVTDFSGCVVTLKKIGSSEGKIGPVNSSGRYKITGVSAGEWRAYCVPNGSTPLAVMTYKQKEGYHPDGTAIKVKGQETVKADFSLRPAGKLAVNVDDQSGPLSEGIYVLIYEAGSTAAAGVPMVTGNYGYAAFANVPLTCKVFVVDPSTDAFIWWDGAQSWDAATVVTLPGQGEGMSITATLTEP